MGFRRLSIGASAVSPLRMALLGLSSSALIMAAGVIEEKSPAKPDPSAPVPGQAGQTDGSGVFPLEAVAPQRQPQARARRVLRRAGAARAPPQNAKRRARARVIRRSLPPVSAVRARARRSRATAASLRRRSRCGRIGFRRCGYAWRGMAGFRRTRLASAGLRIRQHAFGAACAGFAPA